MCRSTANSAPAPRMDLLFGDLEMTKPTTTTTTTAPLEEKQSPKPHLESTTTTATLPPPNYEDLEKEDFAFIDSAGVILATRYKTKMCLSIEQDEECPYQNRCMFAHSEEELRTKEQNLAEGITTEAAIRDHRRRVHMQIKQRNKRKEKRREKQVKKQQLRDMEAQGLLGSFTAESNTEGSSDQQQTFNQQQQQQQEIPHPSAGHPIHTNSHGRHHHHYHPQPQPHFFLDGSYDYSRLGGAAGGMTMMIPSSPFYGGYSSSYGGVGANHFNPHGLGHFPASHLPVAGATAGTNISNQVPPHQGDGIIVGVQQHHEQIHHPAYSTTHKRAMSPMPSSDSGSGGETDSHHSYEKLVHPSDASSVTHAHPPNPARIIPVVLDNNAPSATGPRPSDPSDLAEHRYSISDSAVVVAFKATELKKKVVPRRQTVGDDIAAAISAESSTSMAITSPTSPSAASPSRAWIHNPYPSVVFKVNQGTEPTPSVSSHCSSSSSSLMTDSMINEE